MSPRGYIKVLKQTFSSPKISRSTLVQGWIGLDALKSPILHGPNPSLTPVATNQRLFFSPPKSTMLVSTTAGKHEDLPRPSRIRPRSSIADVSPDGALVEPTQDRCTSDRLGRLQFCFFFSLLFLCSLIPFSSLFISQVRDVIHYRFNCILQPSSMTMRYFGVCLAALAAVVSATPPVDKRDILAYRAVCFLQSCCHRSSPAATVLGCRGSFYVVFADGCSGTCVSSVLGSPFATLTTPISI